MNVIFYLNPKIELGNPLFRLATLRHSIAPQLKALSRSSVNYKVVLSEAVYMESVRDKILDGLDGKGTLITVPEENLTAEDYQEIICDLVKESCDISDFCPDIILSWECDVEFLKRIFPQCKTLYQQPGILSRPPFSKMISFDRGLLGNSVNNNLINKSESEYGTETLNFAREKLKLIDGFNPLKQNLIKLHEKFDSLILVPLQVDGYFTVDEVINTSQFDFLINILNRTPKNVGVIVTQYTSKNVNSDVISPNRKKYLENKYHNFIYNDVFDSLPSVSQYLCPFVDGVVVITSSLGYQASIWKKPLFVASNNSQIHGLRTADTYEEFLEEVLEHKVIDRDSELKKIISNYNVSEQTLFYRVDYLKDFLNTYLENDEINVSRVRKTKDLIDDIVISSQSDLFIKQSAKYFENSKFDVRLGCCIELHNQIDRKEVISFDIFDTLLYRPFFKPVDLFEFISQEAKEIVGSDINFKHIRTEAEKSAFQKAVSNSQFEIKISEIYNEIGVQLDLDSEKLEKLLNLEVSSEKKFLYLRQSGYKAFQYAKSLGRKIILISDMYMEESQLIDILESKGISGYDKLYVSSSYREKKHSGRLFDKVLKESGISPKDIIHIGDNLTADVIKAKDRGIKSFHLEKATDRFSKSPLFEKIWKRDFTRNGLEWNAVLAVQANKLFDNPYKIQRKGSLFNGGAPELGYIGFGPLLFGYTKWLIEESIRNGVEDLYFLARDGKIMKRAYDSISVNYKNAPKSHYLLCSRRAVNVAKIKCIKDIYDLLDVDVAQVRLGDFLKNRFGINPDSVSNDIYHKHGYCLETKIDNTSKFLLKEFLVDISSEILKNAEFERNRYNKYLIDVGYYSSRNKAVVDIGYAGTMQQSLKQLTGLKVNGYYLITFRKALERVRGEGMECYSYLASFIDRHDTYHPFCRFVPLYETLFSSTDCSFIGFLAGSNESQPIYSQYLPNEDRRIQVVSHIHEGAMEFVTEFCAHFGQNLNRFDFEPNKCLRILNEYFTNPSIHDTKIFENVMFEDSYGGTAVKVILNENNPKYHKSHVVWQKGLQCQINSFETHSPQTKSTNVIEKITIEKQDLRTITATGFIDKNTRRLKRFFKSPVKFLTSSKRIRNIFN
ncbi:HAD hydrolase-like protein [Vibrio cholerae]|uniref:HAD family hydrolase n=1 Tax=Vibrio cholerae TaxID=666 RepID=UPI0011F1C1E9|nr:HAD family hydrolase [Vibrio cholerae]KAA0999624.1 HAD hydrolase-like protein [Vibrio cholerae]KAA1006420.1 HAD hydrolase-like protein [Vibrio cholerae]KAA1014749.1 HAD hydrolase-like protein [Vibrio cholerae]KAA1020139.1 HAD hydrolase-like protein [Vibrio cholerae]KAA1024882.1 HAD hydrolase-like protein [Vibrio cholerae]